MPAISNEITIQGNGATIDISINQGSPVLGHFYITQSGHLKLYQLSLSGGVRPRGGAVVNNGGIFFAYDVDFLGNIAVPDHLGDPAHGGAIYSENGKVRIMAASQFLDNIAGDLRYQSNSNGGAIYSRNGSVLILNTSFNNNIALGQGGALYSEKSPSYKAGGMITIQNSTFENNVSRQNGGATVFVDEFEVVNITTTEFTNNDTENYGGAIFSENSKVILSHSRLFSNNANYGGGIYTKREDQGDQSTLLIESSRLTHNHANEIGGAVFSENSDLTLNNGEIIGNYARYCAGIRNGGNASVDVLAGDVNSTNQIISNSSINNSIFLINSAGTDGGGICHLMGELEISNSTIHDNQASGSGGGVVIQSDAEIRSCSIIDNSAMEGGGVMIGIPILDPEGNNYNANIDLSFYAKISGTVVSENEAEGLGAGILVNQNGTTQIENCSITHNHAGWKGGGLYRYAGDLYIDNCTISSNSANSGGGIRAEYYDGPDPSFVIRHTTFVDNEARSYYGWGIGNSGSALSCESVSIKNSIIYRNTCEFLSPGNQSVSGSYGNLAYSCPGLKYITFIDGFDHPQTVDGQTVYPLEPSSRLVDNLSGCAGLAYDQRWVSRPLGNGCDPGAYEYQPNTPPPLPQVTQDHDCDPFFGQEISVGTLNIRHDTLILPVFLRFSETNPGLTQEGTTPYSAQLGDIQASRCDTQGFENRIYCMFILTSDLPGSALPLEVYTAGCEDPIFIHPYLQIPGIAVEESQPDRVGSSCNKNLGKRECEEVGGQYLDLDNPYCLCQ